MSSSANAQCLELLKKIGTNYKFVQPPVDKTVPSTARKLTLVDQQYGDFIQTVRCKEINKYLIDQDPTLTEQSSLSFENSSLLLSEQHQYHQIDAIFTQLQDYLIEVKSAFTAKVKDCLSNRRDSMQQKKKRCEQHVKDMKSLLYYFKQITSNFIPVHQDRRRNV